MNAALERVLQLVAEGRLTADEAAPILDALEERGDASDGLGIRGGDGPGGGAGDGREPLATGRRQARSARIEVFERGKRVVNLRIPISLGRFALARVPGLSAERIDEVGEAIAGGQLGPILDVEDDDGDGVRIVVE